MTKFIREKVSKNKRRYKKDGFDLDLTYITPRIIAMGFPSSSAEAYYRNPLTEVLKFFEHYHEHHYKLYNLCAEREYDVTKFHNRVSRYPFYDHNAPPVNLIQECCKDVEEWLSRDEKNIVGINCKAGKGRTGLIICCYLLHSGKCQTADEAMKEYGEARTKDGKGVTIASQIRYIRYYERVLKEMNSKIPTPPKLKLAKLVITSSPTVQHTHEYITIEMNNELTFVSPDTPLVKKQNNYDVPVGGPVEGDCRIQLIAKNGNKKIKLCHFWFNTGFVDTETDFLKSTIDVANKDKKCKVFKSDFSIKCVFEKWTAEDEEKATAAAKEKKGKEAPIAEITMPSSESEEPNQPEKVKDVSEDGEKDKTEKKSEKSDKKEKSHKGKSSGDDPTGRKRKKSFYSYQDYKQIAEAGVFEDEEVDITSSSGAELPSEEEPTVTTTTTTTTTKTTTSTASTHEKKKSDKREKKNGKYEEKNGTKADDKTNGEVLESDSDAKSDRKEEGLKKRGSTATTSNGSTTSNGKKSKKEKSDSLNGNGEEKEDKGDKEKSDKEKPDKEKPDKENQKGDKTDKDKSDKGDKENQKGDKTDKDKSDKGDKEKDKGEKGETNKEKGGKKDKSKETKKVPKKKE